MKSKGILFAAVVGLLAFSSCTKDWDCECTFGSGETQVVNTETIEASTLKKAREECENKDESTFGSCKLKA